MNIHINISVKDYFLNIVLLIIIACFPIIDLVAQNKNELKNIENRNEFDSIANNKWAVSIGGEHLAYKSFDLQNTFFLSDQWLPSCPILIQNMLSGPSHDVFDDNRSYNFTREFPEIGLFYVPDYHIMHSLKSSYRTITHDMDDNDFAYIKIESERLNINYEINYCFSTNFKINPYAGLSFESVFIDYNYRVGNYNNINLIGFSGRIKSSVIYESILIDIGIRKEYKRLLLNFGMNINSLTYGLGRYSYSSIIYDDMSQQEVDNGQESNIPVSIFFYNKHFLYNIYFRIGYYFLK